MGEEGSAHASESGSRTASKRSSKTKSKTSWARKTSKVMEKYEKRRQKALDKHVERNLREADRNRQSVSPAVATSSCGAMSVTPLDMSVTTRGGDNQRPISWSPRGAPEDYIPQAQGPDATNRPQLFRCHDNRGSGLPIHENQTNA
ncbi:hypothetical protein E2320_002090 [Naja naja]|nr:hypothetical protein E2320_002090 [Naja naja]